MGWAPALLLACCYGSAADAQDGLPAGLALVPQTGCAAEVYYLAYSPDGRYLVAGGRDPVLIVWDALTGVQGLTLEAEEGVSGLAISPDGRLLAAITPERGVSLWSLPRGELRGTLSVPGVELRRCVFSPDGARLLTGSWGSSAYIWDLATGQPVATLDTGEDSLPSGVAYSPDGRLVATAQRGGEVVLWGAVSGERIRRLGGQKEGAYMPTFSPSGVYLASTGPDNTVIIRRVSTGVREATLKGHTQSVIGLAYSPDGKTLVSVQGEGGAIVWDVESRAKRFEVKQDSPVCVAFSPDGRALALGGYRGSVHLYDPETGAQLSTLSRVKPRAYAITVSPEGRWLAAGFTDGAIDEWDLRTGQRLHRTAAHGGSLAQLAYSADGQTLTSLGWDGGWSGSVAAWRAGTGEGLSWDPVGEFASSAWDPEHRLLVLGGKEGQVERWDLETFEHKPTASAQKWWVKSVAISPDGRTVAAGSMDDTIIFWDGATGAELRRLKAPTRWLSPLAFSPDGSLLAIGNTSGGLWLWDLAGDRARHSVKRGLEYAPNFAFSPDGRELAWGGYEAAVHLMDVESGEVRALPTSSKHVYGVAFTPDGRRVVSGGDGALRVWDRESGALLVTLWDTPPTEASPQGEWVTWTPEGHYDCSPGGEACLRVRDSAGGLHRAGEYAYLFHKPECVQEALAR